MFLKRTIFTSPPGPHLPPTVSPVNTNPKSRRRLRSGRSGSTDPRSLRWMCGWPKERAWSGKVNNVAQNTTVSYMDLSIHVLIKHSLGRPNLHKHTIADTILQVAVETKSTSALSSCFIVRWWLFLPQTPQPTSLLMELNQNIFQSLARDT